MTRGERVDRMMTDIGIGIPKDRSFAILAAEDART